MHKYVDLGSLSLRYEDMKGHRNVENGWLGCLEVTQGHFKYHHLIDRIRVPISNCVLSCTISETERDTGRKLPIVTYSTCIWRPSWGDRIGISPKSLVSETIESLDYRSNFDVVYVIPRLAVLVKLRLVTDRQADGQTHRQTE